MNEIDYFLELEKKRSLRISGEDLEKIFNEIKSNEKLKTYVNEQDPPHPSCYRVSKEVTKIVRHHNDEKYTCNKICVFSADDKIMVDGKPKWKNHQAVIVKEKTFVKGEVADLLWVIDPMIEFDKMLRIDEWMQIVYRKAEKKQFQLKNERANIESHQQIDEMALKDELTLGHLIFPAFFDYPTQGIFSGIFNPNNFFYDQNFGSEVNTETDKITIENISKKSDYINYSPLI